MKLRTRVAAYGIAGLVLAGAVIFSGSALGLLSFSSSGALSVLLTDPPSVPDGVTAVYVTYSNVAVHAVGFGDSGWVNVPGQGTIDTKKLVNLSQTISSAELPSLTYNLVAFNISSVKIDFDGKNYTASVGSGRLVVPLAEGLKLNSSSSAAVLVDITPTVLNLGNQSGPNFAMATGAKAVQVPTGEVTESMRQVGNKLPLEGRGWFQSFQAKHSDNIAVSALTLSASSLSFKASNTGSDAVTVRMVVVTQDAPGHGMGTVLGSIMNSAVFAVGTDGSLKLLSGSPGQVQSLLEASGYTLAGGSSFTFTYTGPITSLLGAHGITSGTGYFVTIIGSETLSVQTVTAS